MAKSPKTVGFQLDADYLGKLEREAAKYGDLSPGQFARRIVMNYLDDSERGRIRDRLSDVQQTVELLRVGVADGIEALLIQTGMPKDEAQEFINETIRAEQ